MAVYTVHYWLKNPKDEVVDTSEGGEPLKITLGGSDTIVGLQKAVEGRKAGDRIEATIPSELGYGAHNPDFVSVVDRAMFDIADLAPGMKFQTNTGEQTQIIQVIDVSDSTVTVDANHPLAGLTLRFELDIISVDEGVERSK